MHRRLRLGSVLIALVLLSAGDSHGQGDPGSRPRADGAGQTRALLLELFTSQGCSSCPPADRLLERLGSEPDVIPLSLHVDYWNHLGWRDPFSQAAYSRRQRRYAHAFAADTVYTPQLVIDGRAGVVGSDEDALRAALAERRAAPPEARLAVGLNPPKEAAGEALLRIESEVLKGRWGELALMVATFERGLITKVGRGENARRTLRNDYVVRRLEVAARLSGEPAGPQTVELALAVDAGWDRAQLGVAVFLQAVDSMAVLAAAALPIGRLEAESASAASPGRKAE